MQLIDLSQTISTDMPRFAESWPAPCIRPWMSHDETAASGRYEECSCELTEVNLLTSLGTYLDSPYHFDRDGISIEALPLEQLVLPGICIDCRSFGAQELIGPEVLTGHDFAGKAVLFRTGWSRFWGRPEYELYPFLSGELAALLRDGDARLIGVDYLAADDVRNPRRPVHVTLLHAGVLIVENLTNLDGLPADGFTFHAVPAKVAGAAAFPVRAYATHSGE
jgi:arylformamidase